MDTVNQIWEQVLDHIRPMLHAHAAKDKLNNAFNQLVRLRSSKRYRLRKNGLEFILCIFGNPLIGFEHQVKFTNIGKIVGTARGTGDAVLTDVF